MAAPDEFVDEVSANETRGARDKALHPPQTLRGRGAIFNAGTSRLAGENLGSRLRPVASTGKREKSGGKEHPLDFRHGTCHKKFPGTMPKKHFARKRLSRLEQRNLDIEIDFIEGVIRRDPLYVEALQILGDDYTQRGRFSEGLRVDQQLSKLKPADPLVYYNLACSYSLTGKVEAAVLALDRAITLGYHDFKWIARDPDLESLRTHPLFKRIRSRIRSMQIKIR
jgi:tetratricopeptide (TPR) repeat protein